MQNNDPRYWHSRGYLPHFDQDGFTQFITFRLADSVPQSVLEKWRLELECGDITDADMRRRIEYYLDQHYGKSWLRIPQIANELQETLLKWDGERYRLISWVIMPNHGHILIEPFEENRVSDIMHSIKSYTAHFANEFLNRKGRFWGKEYFDRYIRDQRHFANTIAYIENNPVRQDYVSRLSNGLTAVHISRELMRNTNETSDAGNARALACKIAKRSDGLWILT